VVTRAQVIRKSLEDTANRGGAPKSRWYLSEALWDFILEALEFVSDLFRATNKPYVSIALDTVVSAASRPAATSTARTQSVLRKKLHALSQELAKVEKNTAAFFRIDAQLELLGDLLESGCDNG
jgi:hypothetical protein